LTKTPLTPSAGVDEDETEVLRRAPPTGELFGGTTGRRRKLQRQRVNVTSNEGGR